MASIATINQTEYLLLRLLRLSLQQGADKETIPSLTAQDWEQLVDLADRHEVLPLLTAVVDVAQLPEQLGQRVQLKTARTVHKGLQLQMQHGRLTSLLQEAGIRAISLKGCAMARFYPVPEFRKTTDLDLLVEARQAERAVQLLCDNGFQPSAAWHANHHHVLISAQQIVVELHTRWTESFQTTYLNQYLDKAQRESFSHCQLIQWQGLEFYAYETAWQGFYLLMHMLQHFMGSGFGLRNLCDWVVLWQSCTDATAREVFWRLACQSGTEEFSKAITAIAVQYLGLERAKSPVPVDHLTDWAAAEALLQDCFHAGEFGRSESERMVGMHGDSLWAYVGEFHHQMHINFPRAGRVVLLWPVLWTATLIRFLRNNRRLHRPSLMVILKKAGERGRLVSRLAPKKPITYNKFRKFNKMKGEKQKK